MMNICSRFDVFCNIVAYNVNMNSTAVLYVSFANDFATLYLFYYTMCVKC